MPAHVKRDDRRIASARKPRQQAGGTILPAPEDGRNSAAGQSSASSSSLVVVQTPHLTALPSTVAPAVEQVEETVAASPTCRMNAAAEDEYNETRSTSASESEEPPEIEDSDDEPEGKRVELPHNYSTLAAKPLWADMESSSDEGNTPTAKELQVAKATQHGLALLADALDSDDEKRLSAGAKQKARRIVERGAARRLKASGKAGRATSSSSDARFEVEVPPELSPSAKEQAQYYAQQWAEQGGWWSQEPEEHVDWGSKAYTWKGSKSSRDWWGNGSQQCYRATAWSGSAAAASSWSGKPQCQFFIGIEEEPKFKVTRKILGPHGQNMKDIALSTGAKLRLRGRGSGFKEGEEQQESTDELMLCVSTTDWESYQEAVCRVSELLQGVYEQYRVFRKKAGSDVPELKIRMHEGPRPGSR